MLNGGPISWQSRTQPSVALSTLEAEYMAMTESTKECIWLRSLIEDLGFKQKNRTCIKVDNQSALQLAENPEFHARSKHIDIRFHFVRDEEVKGKVMFEYVSSASNMADVFTKALDGTAVQQLQDDDEVEQQSVLMFCSLIQLGGHQAERECC